MRLATHDASESLQIALNRRAPLLKVRPRQVRRQPTVQPVPEGHSAAEVPALAGLSDPLAECQPVTAGHLHYKVAQAPWMIGQARDNRGAACRAPLMQVIHAGDTDIDGGRGVDARARRPDQRESHCVAAQQQQPISGSSTSTSNPSTSRKNAAAGASSPTSRLGRQLKNSITAAY